MPTPRHSRTSSASCSSTRPPPPTARNGSTPGSTTCTGSPAPPRASGSWTTRPAGSWPRTTPITRPPRPPLSSPKTGARAAGAIKSGGTTRRAAKMVILDVDHPDIEEFVDWKKVEEDKVRALIAAGYSSDFNGDAYQTVSGQNSNNSVRVDEAFLRPVAADADWPLPARTE